MKYEGIYIEDYDQVSGLTTYSRSHDEDRPHLSLGYRTPGEIYRTGTAGATRGGGP